MIAALLALALAAEPPPQVLLHQVEVVDRAGGPFDPARPGLRLTIELRGHDDAPLLSRRLGRKPSSPGKLVLESLGYPPSADPVEARHRAPSFVLDYTEPSVAAVAGSARASLGPHPDVAALAAFVASFIEKKDLSRSYDVASVVAARRQGDCSEHAVLLAALARAFGVPARVVHGLVLVSWDGAAQAFGHAWVEVHDGRTWRPADAALPKALPRAYVPLSLLDSEGPGFVFSALMAVSRLAIQRVVLDGPSGRAN